MISALTLQLAVHAAVGAAKSMSAISTLFKTLYDSSPSYIAIPGICLMAIDPAAARTKMCCTGCV